MRRSARDKTAALLVWLLAGTSASVASAGPGTIRLACAEFDPLSDGEPLPADVPDGPALRAAVDRYRLAQFDSPIDAGLRGRLAAAGLEVVGYVPQRTLIVRLPAPDAEPRLRALAGLRWSGAVRPDYKLSPALRQRLAEPGAGSTATIRAFLFTGEDPAALAAALAVAIDGARVVFAASGPRPRIDLDLPAARLAPAVGGLIADPAVQYVAERPRLVTYNDEAVWIGQSYDRDAGPAEAAAADPKPYPESAAVWNRGLNGAGQVIAVADTGLEHGTCFFDDPQVELLAQNVAPPGDLVLQPEHRKVLALNAPLAGAYATDDPFRHGTHVASSALGDDRTHPVGALSAGHDHGDGMAPAAKLVFEDISGAVQSDCFTSIVVTSLDDLLEQEYRAGARISSNSWGGPGDQSASIDVDARVWEREDMLVVFSAGNDGGDSLNAYAACKNCLTVGASENYDADFGDAFGTLDPENMAAFSSRGPTADGRTKPDVVAPGFRVDSARFPVEYYEDESDPACSAGGFEACFPSFGGCYVTDPGGTCHTGQLLGTSMSTPITAGLAALGRQYFVEGFHPGGIADPAEAREPSAALLRAVLINGARNLGGRLYERRGAPSDLGPLADAPSDVQGWGRVVLDDVLHFAGDSRGLRLFDLPNAAGLATGETIRLPLAVTSSAEPLKLTLAWTDAPAQPLAGNALVNDLDLELVAPDGTLYRGNQWTADDVNVPGDRRSLADPPGRDALNNVEGVWLPAPAVGLYTIRVVGHDVPGEPGRPTQGAALVTAGAVAACSEADPPAGLHVESFSEQSLTLAWDAVPGALGYTLYRNASGCASPMPADHVTALGPGVTTSIDADVVPNQIYHYTVRARVSAEGCETEDSACVSALAVDGAAPPPVPDGDGGTPLVVAKGPTPFRLDLGWDAASCPAEGHHLLYGALGQAATGQVTGAACGLGPGGTFHWFGVPGGDLWFLVVGSSAGKIEGDWGARSDGTPRGGGTVSGRCGMLVRDDNGSCGDGRAASMAGRPE